MAEKPKLTPAELRAAEALRRLWDTRQQRDLTQEKAAEQLGMTQGAFSQYLNRHIAIGTEAAMKFAAFFGVPIGEIRPDIQALVDALGEARSREAREAPAVYRTDYVTVPLRDARAAAGGGAVNDYDAVIGGLQFLRRSLARRNLSSDTLQTVFAKGDSMAPRILDGDALLVDTSQRNPYHGRVFVVSSSDDGERVKRLHRSESGGWLLVSDNNADGSNPPIPVPADWRGFRIVGRVVWTGGWMP